MKKVAKIILVDPKNKYLIMYRNNHPKFGNDPDLPGGTLEDNETPLKTMVREVKEETSLDIINNPVSKIYSGSEYSVDNTHYILFIAKLDIQPQVILSWEHSKHEWLESDKFIQKSADANDTYMHMVADVLRNILPIHDTQAQQ